MIKKQKLIEREVKDKIIKEFGSYDRRVHRAIELAQQKTAQAIFDEVNHLPSNLEGYEKLKKNWDVK